MRKRYFVVLAAVMCFALPFIVLGAGARSAVHITHVSKNELGLYVKRNADFQYNAESNRWECLECREAAGNLVHDKRPVILKPVLIGKQNVPAYYERDDRGDGCSQSYAIITDRSYAIVISTSCNSGSDKRLERYVKSFIMPKGVHAIRAKEEAGWQVIDQ
ncbi:MAG TPA: hypothetical protein VFC63_20785 [Blastocatellia bacterium]|nr:hypothetical protein [Blastocatellia bacterium]